MSQERKKPIRRSAAGQAVPVSADAVRTPVEAQPPARRRAAGGKSKPLAKPRAVQPVATAASPAERSKGAASAKSAPARQMRAAAKTPAARTSAEVATETVPRPPHAAVLSGAESAPTIAVGAPEPRPLPAEPVPEPVEPARLELSESELRDRIGRRATEIWLSHGGLAQGPIEDWLQAEAEVRRTLEVVASV